MKNNFNLIRLFIVRLTAFKSI